MHCSDFETSGIDRCFTLDDVSCTTGRAKDRCVRSKLTDLLLVIVILYTW